MDTQLLFVNKTSSSIRTRSNDVEKTKILRHVQSKRRKAEAKNKPLEPWTSLTSTISSNDCNTNAPKPLKATTKLPHHHSLMPVYETFLPSSYPSFNASDPFHCTSAHTLPNTHILLQHIFSVASPNFLAEAFAPPKTCSTGRTIRHDAIFSARLRQCIHDETHMYATLAYGSSLLGWMTGRFQTHPPEYFLSKALPSVRKRLAESNCQVDNWLLLSMYALAVTEMWNGVPSMWKGNERYGVVMRMSQYGFAACRVHLKALLELVMQNGGWERFDAYVLDSALLADKYLALSDMQRPVIPVTFDPGPLSKLHRQGLGVGGGVLSELGQGLLRRNMSSSLREAIVDLVDYCQTAQQLWCLPIVDCQSESWLFRRLQALTYRLLHVYHDMELGLEDNCVCVATLTFIFGSITGKGPQVSASRMAMNLYAHLLAEEAAGDDLHLWYLFTGAMMLDESVEQAWFIERLTAFGAGCLSEEDIIKKMRVFLFLEDKQGSLLRALMKKLRPNMQLPASV